MGAVIGGLLGLNGGASGSGYAAPAQANIINPTNQYQLNNAYQGTQGSLASQQQLLTALQGQNGIGNQSQVYGQLQGVANGTGPNPAQAMLNQATGANVANQAALMAGQRGAGANVGLIARQAAQQGAQAQQQAAGQAATLQANQSLNALNSAGSLANTQASQQLGQTNANAQTQLAQQQALLGAQQGVNNANVASQGNVNSANAGLANTTMQGQQTGIGGLINGLGGAVGGLFKGAAGAVDATPGILAAAGPEAAGIGEGAMAGGAADAAGSGLAEGLLLAAKGGEIKGPRSKLGQHLKSGKGLQDYKSGGAVQAGPGQKAVASGNSYSNDKIPALLSEHEIVLPREVTMSKDPVKASAKFVASVIAKRKTGKK